MRRFSPFYFLFFALVVVSVFSFTNHVFAFGKPDGVGSGNPGVSRENNPGSKQETGHTEQISGTVSITVSVTPTEKEHVPFHQLNEDSHEGSPSSHLSAFEKHNLQGSKLTSCQSIQKALTNRSTHLVSLVTQMEEKFTSIAKGVEQYYLTNVVPTGATLSNYDSLVADITTKQNALTPLVAAAQSDATNFSCTSTNPGAQMTQYRTDMQGVLQGLQAYRTSIKNLIVAVRTLPSVSVTPSSVPSASPTEVPSPSPVTTSVTP
ncbi:MAG TPA: hypothetical protein VND99_03240 [Candidatus Acidoferrales bacterium]|nr:hypothetical protein [Candidatus Acidoferrales bacterium]